MKHIILPEGARKNGAAPSRSLVYYLAAEEYVADTVGEGFFLWTSGPTVIFGRNQDLYAEVNVDYCRSNGIDIFRRKSGGGCVYSDKGNLMMSCIVRSTGVQESFSRYLSSLVRALEILGLPAVSSEHNDVLVNGRKVSGNACFARGNSTIIHGTLLVDMDFGILQKAITPSEDKLASHGVKSVRQRVASLSELGLSAARGYSGTGMSEDGTIERAILNCFCDGRQALDRKAEEAILELEKSYLDTDFIERGVLKSGI